MKTLERPDLATILKGAAALDVTPLRVFFFHNPSQPLLATGSGADESAADFAALLYAARCGIGQVVTPFTLNSISDSALKTSKLLLISASGHNNDIVFATRRALAVNPGGTAAFSLLPGERNRMQSLLAEGGAENQFCFPVDSAPEASLDLLIRSTEFFLEFCDAVGVNPDTPKNPGKIDKRVPMSIPFTSELKKAGPLTLQ